LTLPFGTGRSVTPDPGLASDTGYLGNGKHRFKARMAIFAISGSRRYGSHAGAGFSRAERAYSQFARTGRTDAVPGDIPGERSSRAAGTPCPDPFPTGPRSASRRASCAPCRRRPRP